MPSTRIRDGLIAACSAIVILLLARYLPPGWPRIALAVGVVVFLLYLYLVPRFWYRRIVGIVLFLWAGAIATPSIFAEVPLPDNAFLRILVEGGGWSVHAPLCLAFIASLVASIRHEEMMRRGSRKSDGDVIHGDKTGGDKVGGDKIGGDKVGGDKVGGNKSVHEAGRDIHHSEDSMSIHHHYAEQGPEKLVTSFLNQIPKPTVDFVGREEEITSLMAAFEEAGQGAVIVGARGMGGVGKTELAKVLANRLKDHFPDGQLYFNLRGASDDEATKPATAIEALSHVIRSFEPEAQLPEDVDTLRGKYNSVLHGKRVLLLMDNALNAGQLAPLTPPPDGCALIVTSRQKFVLAGMESVDLDTLPPEKARELLLEICPRIGDEANALAERCGYLPLALRLAGSALEMRPTLGVEDYLDDLSTQQGRLAALDEYKDAMLIGIEASLSTSYKLLSEDQQQFWRGLSVFPGGFDALAAASVGQSDDLKAGQKILGALCAASMVQWDEATGRFRLHDLARDYGRDQLSEAERGDVEERHAEHYLAVLRLSDQLYKEGGDSILLGLALFDRERSNIVAGQMWAARHRELNKIAAKQCAAYPIAGAYCVDLRLHSRQQISWNEAAVQAARSLNDREAEGILLGNLGSVLAVLGETKKAIKNHLQALLIARETGDRGEEGNVLGNLGTAYGRAGESLKAIEYYKKALVIVQEIGNRRTEGNTLGNLGNTAASMGELLEAIDYYEEALVILHEIGDQLAVGASSHNIARVLDKLDRRDEAITYAEAAVEIYEQIESPDLATALAQLERLRKLRD